MGDLMSEKMRDEFDVWYFDMFPLEKAMIEAGSASSARNRDLYLRCWQASREALVIELPEAYETDSDGYWMLPQKDVWAAIEAAGLKVTP